MMRRSRHRFSKVLFIVPFYTKCTGALTFENVCRARLCDEVLQVREQMM